MASGSVEWNFGGNTEICAVVVTYNAVPWLDKCLGSLQRSTVPVQTIVVDNASSDETVAFVRSHYLETIVIENPENEGFGRANNRGIRLALDNQASFIYLMNQDAWIEPNVIAGLAQLMEAHSEYGIISPMQYAGNGKNLDAGFRNLLTPDNCEQTGNLYPARFVMAAHWLVRAKAIRETGGFMPLFRHYGEDRNLIDRMAFYGWKTGIAPNLKAFHDRENRRNTGEQQLKIQYARFLALASNINRPAGSILPCWMKLEAAILRIKVPFFRRLIYSGKALGKIIPVLYYRHLSKQSKNKALWI